MVSLEEQLKRSVALLQENGLEFAIAGGVAASVYRDEDRVTKDVDFLIGGSGNLVKIGTSLINQLGLSAHIARQANLDGGPLFAIKKKSSPEMVIIGRDPKKEAPGVDFLLPNNNWAPRALQRAQLNQLDWGFSKIATMTVEDVVVAKLIASHKAEREQDILDIRSIFRAKNEIDLIYLIARMKEFRVTVARVVAKDVPYQLLRASKRIARDLRKGRKLEK